MRQHKRFEYIIESVQKAGFITIDELAEALNVTPQTIRRDLTQLEAKGEVKRYHGGVGTAEQSTKNTEYNARKSQNSEAKNLIAARVADQIPDGSSVFINIGTTTEAVAKALINKKDLTIVTNNLNVAATLADKDDFTVIVAGGEVRNGDGGIVGEPAVELVRQFQMEYAIIGISGIQPDGTLLDYDLREVRVSQTIIENARDVFLCADSSKFGRSPMVKLGHLSQIDQLFTDKPTTPEYSELFAKYEVIVRLPE